MAPRKKNMDILNIPYEFRIEVEKILQNFIRDINIVEYTFPCSLTREERKFIHNIAQERGLTSRSHGKEPNRCLRITKSGATITHLESSSFKLSKQISTTLENNLRLNPLKDNEKNIVKTYMTSNSNDDSVKKVLRSSMARLDSNPPLVPIKINSNSFTKFRKNLPIYEHKNKILDSIKKNKVTLICGETGSGKTTQVPQYIMEDCANRGEVCRIICCQPRRISAISVADRVSVERGEDLGRSVGYKIRLESNTCSKTILTYCTNGILLRTLISGEAAIKTVTHIIVDEVHERDSFSDFLLICLRQLLFKKNNKLNFKLILMSATMDTSLFIKYFNNPVVINVPGRLFDVTEYYLEDILQITNYKNYLMEKIEMRQKSGNNLLKKAVDIVGACNSPVENPETNEQNDYADELIELCFSNGDDEYFNQLMYLFMSEGLNVNYRHSVKGIPGLIAAVVQNKIDIISQLFGLGAKDVDMAIEYAKRVENNDLIKYLKEMHANSTKSKDNEDDVLKRLKFYQETVSEEYIDFSLTIDLIKFIMKKDDKSNHHGSILIFLPGYDDITTLKQMVGEDGFINSNVVLFTLHSNMQTQHQREVFKPVEKGKRKLILSTNIAETSITIDDVVYVIDGGKVKEKNFDSATNVCSLQCTWISKSCAKQRAGRAGRTQPGECYHLFSKARWKSMELYPTPEILRLPLHELCLQAKMHIPENYSIAEFLANAIEPPSPLVVRNAIESLKTLGALDNKENLTPLGAHLIELSIEPHLGKAILFSLIMKCLDPVLTIACILAHKDPFTIPSPVDKARQNQVKFNFAEDTYSDHMVVLRAFQMWENLILNNKKRLCLQDYFISSSTFDEILATRQQIIAQLKVAQFIQSTDPEDLAYLNQNSSNWAVVKAVLTAGLYPNIAHYTNPHRIRTQREKRVLFHNSSVMRAYRDRDRNKQKTNWIIFDEITRQGRVYQIRGNTFITPVTVLLFGGPWYIPEENIYDENDDDSDDDDEETNGKKPKRIQVDIMTVKLDAWITFSLNPNDIRLLTNLRFKLFALFVKKLLSPYRNVLPEEEQIVECVVNLLTWQENEHALVSPKNIGQKPTIRSQLKNNNRQRNNANFNNYNPRQNYNNNYNRQNFSNNHQNYSNNQLHNNYSSSHQNYSNSYQNYSNTYQNYSSPYQNYSNFQQGYTTQNRASTSRQYQNSFVENKNRVQNKYDATILCERTKGGENDVKKDQLNGEQKRKVYSINAQIKSDISDYLTKNLKNLTIKTTTDKSTTEINETTKIENRKTPPDLKLFKALQRNNYEHNDIQQNRKTPPDIKLFKALEINQSELNHNNDIIQQNRKTPPDIKMFKALENNQPEMSNVEMYLNIQKKDQSDRNHQTNAIFTNQKYPLQNPMMQDVTEASNLSTHLLNPVNNLFNSTSHQNLSSNPINTTNVHPSSTNNINLNQTNALKSSMNLLNSTPNILNPPMLPTNILATQQSNLMNSLITSNYQTQFGNYSMWGATAPSANYIQQAYVAALPQNFNDLNESNRTNDNQMLLNQFLKSSYTTANSYIPSSSFGNHIVQNNFTAETHRYLGEPFVGAAVQPNNTNQTFLENGISSNVSSRQSVQYFDQSPIQSSTIIQPNLMNSNKPTEQQQQAQIQTNFYTRESSVLRDIHSAAGKNSVPDLILSETLNENVQLSTPEITFDDYMNLTECFINETPIRANNIISSKFVDYQNNFKKNPNEINSQIETNIEILKNDDFPSDLLPIISEGNDDFDKKYLQKLNAKQSHHKFKSYFDKELRESYDKSLINYPKPFYDSFLKNKLHYPNTQFSSSTSSLSNLTNVYENYFQQVENSSTENAPIKHLNDYSSKNLNSIETFNQHQSNNFTENRNFQIHNSMEDNHIVHKLNNSIEKNSFEIYNDNSSLDNLNSINGNRQEQENLQCNEIMFTENMLNYINYTFKSVMEQLRYPSLIRYFVIKVPTLAMIDISLMKNTWLFDSKVEEKFGDLLQEQVSIILLFTVHGSEQYQGVAELIGGPRHVETISQAVYDIHWISRANIYFSNTSHLTNKFNNNRRIHSCQDGQEVDPDSGSELFKMFLNANPDVQSYDIIDIDTPNKHQTRPIVKTN